MALRIHKVVGALPAQIEPDAVYAVRAGAGFDLYVADSTGAMAHPLNASSLPAAAAPAPTFVGPITPGRWYDGAINGNATQADPAVADRIELHAFVPPRNARFDRAAIRVSNGAVAGAQARGMIYGALADGSPGPLLLQTPEFDCSAIDIKEVPCDVTLTGGALYYIGVWTSAAISLVTLTQLSIPAIGGSSYGGGNFAASVLRRIVPFAQPAPAAWGLSAADMTGNVRPAALRLRAA